MGASGRKQEAPQSSDCPGDATTLPQTLTGAGHRCIAAQGEGVCVCVLGGGGGGAAAAAVEAATHRLDGRPQGCDALHLLAQRLLVLRREGEGVDCRARQGDRLMVHPDSAASKGGPGAAAAQDTGQRRHPMKAGGQRGGGGGGSCHAPLLPVIPLSLQPRFRRAVRHCL